MSRVEVEPTIITIYGKGRLIRIAVKRVSNVLLVIKLGEICLGKELIAKPTFKSNISVGVISDGSTKGNGRLVLFRI